MYLLDPKDGRHRRAVAADKAVHAYHVSNKALRRSSVDLAKRSRGLVAGAKSALHKNGLLQQGSLTGRVRSKLGLSRKRRLSLPPTASLIAGTAGGALALAGLVGMLRR